MTVQRVGAIFRCSMVRRAVAVVPRFPPFFTIRFPLMHALICCAIPQDCGVQLTSLQLILSTDGEEVYCVCRQPDDLQRLMIGCDHCPVWYHIHCIGISPAKAKALQGDGANFMCPACCAKQSLKYGFEPRVTQPTPKRLPGASRVVRFLRRADDLTLRVEEEALLRKALKSCRLWQAEEMGSVVQSDWRGASDEQVQWECEQEL